MKKFILKSKTVAGAIIAASPILLPMLGITLSGEEASLISASADPLVQLFGLMLVVYGRYKAGGVKFK